MALGFGLSYILFGAFFLYETHVVESPGVPPTIWTEN